jgi:hypothetical protein
MRKSRLAWTQRKTREAHIGAKAWAPGARARSAGTRPSTNTILMMRKVYKIRVILQDKSGIRTRVDRLSGAR